MENLVKIRTVPFRRVEENVVKLSGIVIINSRTSITKNKIASNTEVFLSPFYAKKLAIYCDKKAILKDM